LSAASNVFFAIERYPRFVSCPYAAEHNVWRVDQNKRFGPERPA